MAGRDSSTSTVELRSYEARKQLGDLLRINALRVKPCVGLLWIDGAVDLPRNTQTHFLASELCLLGAAKPAASEVIAVWNREVCWPPQPHSDWRSVVESVYRHKAQLRGYGCKSGAVAHSSLCLSNDHCDWRGRAKGPANVERDWRRFEEALGASHAEQALSPHACRALKGIIGNGRLHGILPEAPHFVTYRQIAGASGLGLRFVRAALLELKQRKLLRRLHIPRPLPSAVWSAAQRRLREGGQSRHATRIQLRVPPPKNIPSGSDLPLVSENKPRLLKSMPAHSGEQILILQSLVHAPSTLTSSPSDNGGSNGGAT